MTDGEYTIDELKALEAEEYTLADEPEEEEAQQDDEPSQLQLPESTEEEEPRYSARQVAQMLREARELEESSRGQEYESEPEDEFDGDTYAKEIAERIEKKIAERLTKEFEQRMAPVESRALEASKPELVDRVMGKMGDLVPEEHRESVKQFIAETNAKDLSGIVDNLDNPQVLPQVEAIIKSKLYDLMTQGPKPARSPSDAAGAAMGGPASVPSAPAVKKKDEVLFGVFFDQVYGSDPAKKAEAVATFYEANE